MDWKIYNSPELVIQALSETLLALSRSEKIAHIALSGGSTPKRWFSALAQPNYGQNIKWHNLHFWWGDERCVPPESEESNFGAAYELLFRHIAIPAKNIHRIRGEERAEKEAERYASEIDEWIGKDKENIPSFDWIILGMGADGHTASLFPGKTDFCDRNLTTTAYNPVTKTERISLTAKTLAAGKRVSYLVLGKEKREIIEQIYRADKKDQQDIFSLPFPAAHIRSQYGITEWYIDQQIAE